MKKSRILLAVFILSFVSIIGLFIQANSGSESVTILCSGDQSEATQLCPPHCVEKV